jgi:hypothetical protein
VIVRIADGDIAGGGPGVLDHVGERLLHDPVGGQVDARRDVPARALAPKADPDPGVGGARDEAVQVSEPGRGEQRRPGLFLVNGAAVPAARGVAITLPGDVGITLPGDVGITLPGDVGVTAARHVSTGAGTGCCCAWIGLAQDPEQALHLGKGFTARRLDGVKRRARLGGLCVDDMVAEAGLYRDDGHAVRDDVVEFTRDAQALPSDRAGRHLLLQTGRVAAPLPRRVANRPGDADEQAHWDDAAAERPPGRSGVLHRQQAEHPRERGDRHLTWARGRDHEEH